MDSLNTFAITIVTTLIFMTAVEVVAPDNSMKKYIKFVLGLILVAVMISPIVSFFTNGEEEIRSKINKYQNEYSNDRSDSEINAVETTTKESFKKNLDRNCDLELSSKFEKLEFQTDIDCELDKDKMTYVINSIKVGIKDKKVRKVDKVDIDISVNSKNEENVNDEYREIVYYIESLFKISSGKINIYRVND